MRGLVKGLLVFLFISSMMTLTAFADEFNSDDYPLVTPESVILPPERTKAEVWYRPKVRGDIIAVAHLSISNEGNGTIGVFAQTTTYLPIDKCRTRIYLDYWDENTKSWIMENYWDYTFLKENEPDGELIMPTILFNVKARHPGSVYRLRGLHVVWLNSGSEGLSTETDGIKITK